MRERNLPIPHGYTQPSDNDFAGGFAAAQVLLALPGRPPPSSRHLTTARQPIGEMARLAVGRVLDHAREDAGPYDRLGLV